MSWFGRRGTTDETDGPQVRRWAALVRHEMVQLVALTIIAVAAFFVTRAVAAGNRAMVARDAAEWYRRGREAMSAGRFDEATDALHRAAARRRGEPAYALALARALASRGDTAAARLQLLALRDATPEDPLVNLELARLAVVRNDFREAQRFYYNALYAPWSADRAEERRRVRMELVRALTTAGESARALAELVAVSAETPADPEPQIEIARLFATAGDHRRALTHFQQALARSPGNQASLEGAGLAAFRLGEYPLARQYLHRSDETTGAVAATREIVDLVLDRDPLAPRLGARERRRRVDAAIARARERLALCTTPLPDAAAETPASLGAALDAFVRRLPQRSAIDQDTAEDALELASRVERYAGERCAPAAPVDRALLLIALRHGTGGQ